MRFPHGSRKSRKRPGRIFTPAAASAARTASLSSTTRPKCRPVTGLLAALLKGKKLIPKIDEHCLLALAAQGEFTQAPVEGGRLLDVPHLEGDVVQSNGASFAGCGHGACLEYSPLPYVVAMQRAGNADRPILTERAVILGAAGSSIGAVVIGGIRMGRPLAVVGCVRARANAG